MAKERIYETMIIVKTDMTQEERDSVVAMVKGWIEEKVEGTIQESVRWGIRKLAYEIPKGHIKEGDYNYFIYSASPEKVAVLETSIKRSYELTDRTKYYETLYMLKDTILTIIRLKKYDYDYERKNYLVELENVDYKIYSLLKNELTEVQDDMQYYNNYEMNFNIALFTLDNLYTEDLFFKYSTVDLLPIIMQLKKTSTESSQRIINLYLNKIERDRTNEAYPELLLKSIETLVRW